MMSIEKISERYIKLFESYCPTCPRRNGGACSFTPDIETDVKLRWNNYLKCITPRIVDIPCIHIQDKLKPDFDAEMKEILERIVLEQARQKVGSRTLTGKKMIEGR